MLHTSAMANGLSGELELGPPPYTLKPRHYQCGLGLREILGSDRSTSSCDYIVWYVPTSWGWGVAPANRCCVYYQGGECSKRGTGKHFTNPFLLLSCFLPTHLFFFSCVPSFFAFLHVLSDNHRTGTYFMF